MGYRLKYYKEVVSQDHEWRVEIYQDTDEPIQAVEIGPVLQGLKLIVQGDQADIDTPIVKTSLEMVFVDAPDLDFNCKCGHWEEFYTSSSFEYKVILLKDGSREWTGYITPDSFSEELCYRGSVTLLARDNIGLFNDFTFDARSNEYGLVCIEDIIENAIEYAKVDMNVIYGSSSLESKQNTFPQVVSIEDAHSSLFYGDSIVKSYVNASALKDKSYWDAITDIMYSLGLVMRYIGRNTISIVPIKSIGLYNRDMWLDVPVVDDFKFVSYGHRELSPALKSVEDLVEYDIEEQVGVDAFLQDSFENESSAEYDASLEYAFTTKYDIPIHSYKSNGFWVGKNESESLLLDKRKYANNFDHYTSIEGDDKLLIAANVATNDGRSLEYKQALYPGIYTWEISFDSILALYNDMTSIGSIDRITRLSSYTYSAYWISEESSLKKEIVNGEWQNVDAIGHITTGVTVDDGTLPFVLKLPALETAEIGILSVSINRIGVIPYGNGERSSKGSYVLASATKLVADNLPKELILSKSRIVTLYNEKNNIAQHRDVKFGYNTSEYSMPQMVANGIYIFSTAIGKYSGKHTWNPGNTKKKGVELARLLHEQILAYYSRPMNILTGTLINPYGDLLWDALYKWNNELHVLLSGSYNILTSQMENVVLRAFQRYDKMWLSQADKELLAFERKGDYIDVAFRWDDGQISGESSFRFFPNWLEKSLISYGNKTSVWRFTANSDVGVNERVADFALNGVWLRAIQRAAGDYGYDYSEDYS